MPDWDALFGGVAPHPILLAETFVKAFHTASRPVLLECDGGDYVIKSRSAGRMIITDQIVGRIGVALDAPVAEVALVDVPQDLIDSEPQMSHIAVGVAHASRWIPDCTDQTGFQHVTVPENRDRFARLALMYGLVMAGDHQFIYNQTAPELVHSMDHGHFFAGSTGWTVETLAGAPPPAVDSNVQTQCALAVGELAAAKSAMHPLRDQDIAAAVTAPRDEWGIASHERIALATYLADRRDVMFGPLDDGEEEE